MEHDDVSKRDALILKHMGMALGVARKMAARFPPHVCREDIESAAIVGLVEAAGRYDFDRAEPFFAYATKRVRGAVMDELRKDDILSRRNRKKVKRVFAAKEALQLRLGREAALLEIADELGIKVSEVEKVRVWQTASWQPLDDAQHPTSSESPYARLVEVEKAATVNRVLNLLPPRDRRIVWMYFRDNLTMAVIAKKMGLTEGRISQIIRRGIGPLALKLRHVA